MASPFLRLVCFSMVAIACTQPPSPVVAREAPELRTISIEVATSWLPAGTRQLISAFGFYADGSKRDLTSQLKWRSSDGTLIQVVARADGQVEVLAQKPGVAIVQGFLDNDSAAIPVHVTGG